MLALRPPTAITYGSPSYAAPTPPVEPRQSMWDWYRSLKGEEEAPTAMQSAVTGLRHNAEGAAVGAMLGFIDGEFGTLDIQGRYPVDGIAAAIAFLLSVRDADKPNGFAGDLRAISQSCVTTLTYRKTKAWRESVKGLSHVSIPRNTDPIVAAGKMHGF